MYRIGRTRSALALLCLLTTNGTALADDTAYPITIVEGLQEFSVRVDELATFGVLDDPLPLMALSPVGDDGLRLAELFEESLNARLLEGAIDTLADLQAAIDDADDDVGGVSIVFDDVVVGLNADDPSLVDVSFTVVATRTGVLAPIIFTDDASINFEGGSIELAFSLSVSLFFQLDTTEKDVAQAFYLAELPSIDISVDATGDITGFSDIVGIGDVTVTGTAMLDLDLGVDFLDPDDNGRLTADEWMNTSFADLVDVGFREEDGNEVEITLDIDSALVGDDGSIEGIIALIDDSLVDGLDLPVVDLGCMGDFGNVSPSEILSGLSLLACTVNATEAFSDVHLPFLQQTLGDTLDLGQPLADFLKQQIEVAFTCGTIDDDPPRGDIVNLATDDVFYCQATALDNPVFVEWLDTGNVAVVSGGADLSTLGANPTTNVTLQMTADGRPDVRLEFMNSKDKEFRSASRAFLTAEELLGKLVDLGGFDATLSELDYDCDTSSLTVRLVASFDPEPFAEEVELDFFDRLQSVANLADLGATAAASASVDPKDMVLDLTFGVIMVEDIADITPADDDPPEEFDRFFIKPRMGENEHEFQASANIEGTIDLTGVVGFLGVTVVGDGAANLVTPGVAFEIVPASDGSPLLAVDINTPTGGVPIEGTPGISDAILVGDLLEDPQAWTKPTFSIRMSGGLRVEAGITDPPISASGTISIEWADASTGAPTLTLDSDFAGALMLFDTDPSVYGSHTGRDNEQILTDTTQDFSALPIVVGRTLRNLTDGSTCLVTAMLNQNELECALSAGTDNDWDVGDEYQLEGNPLDMLSVILDGLDLVVQGIDALTGDLRCGGTSEGDPCSNDSECGGDECLIADSALNTELPLVGVSPEDLLGFLDDLESALDEIRTGEPDALIICTWDPPDNDDDGVLDQPADNLVGLPPGTAVECHAMADAQPATVSWTIIDLATGASSPASSNDAAVETVGPNPTKSATFDITEGGSIGRDFQIRVDFSYPDSGDHSVELAQGAFTLQALEELIENKLGIPPMALQLELLNLPPPGGTKRDEIFDLVLRLGFGECTTGNSTILCSTSDRMVEQPGIRLSLPLEELIEDLPGLVGLDAKDPKFKLEYRARAQLDLAIPLTFNSTGDPVVVVDSSGVTVEVAATADMLGISASIGPLMLNLDGQANIGAKFSLAPASKDQTFTIEGYFANLTGTLEGPDQQFDCGELIIPLIVTGTHQGEDGADVLSDPGMFGDVNVGAQVLNETTGQDCEATKVTEDTISCVDKKGKPLISWDMGDAYKVIDEEGGETTALNGDACANFSLEVILDDDLTLDVGFLGFVAKDITNPDTWTAQLSVDDLLGCLDLECLAFDLLLEGLSFVVEQITAVLEGGGPKLNLPLLGDRLDGGSGVCSSLGGGNEGLLGVLDGLAALLNEIKKNGTAGNIESGIQVYIFDAVTGLGLLKDINADGSDPTIEDVEVTILCDADAEIECKDDDEICEIDDIRVRFRMGQGVVGDRPGCTGDENDCPPGATDLPFDLGIPGVPLTMTGALEAKVGWQYLVDFGLSRTDGPYLAATGPGHDEDRGEAELIVGASVGLLGTETCDPEDTGIPELDNGYSTDGCVVGSIAFLETIVRDGDGTVPGVDPTEIALLSKLNIVSGSDRIGFSQLADGDLGLVLSIEAIANADLRFRTQFDDSVSAKLPSVLGTFQLKWDIAGFEGSTTDGTRLEFNSMPRVLSFENMYLDVGGFFSEFLLPMLKDVSKALKPVKPVIDTVRAPVPLVSDLSQLVGGPKVTLLNLLELANGAPLPMINNIIALTEFITAIADRKPDTLLIPLGSDGFGPMGGRFDVDTEAALMGPQTPDKAGQLVQNSNGRTGITSEIVQDAPASLSFPFLEDSSQIFAMLMGQDVTLVRYDFGVMKAVATLGPFTYCCIPVGPVPVSVFIEGSATLAGRFAMGYDTVGLRKAFSRKQFDATVLIDVIDGVFIDDLDAQGCDVPEITLKGEVRAGAGVDLGFAAAGLDGGVTFTVDLNLDDRPEPDGKLRIDEVVDRISNPICLFDVSGRLEAFLGAWVRVGFEWFSKSWRFEIMRITLLEFSAACAPPNPAPATVMDGNLQVNIGSSFRRGRRRFNVDEIDEEVVIRQLNIEGTKFSVALMGFIEEYEIDSGGFIDIQGDDGDDVISLEPGVLRVATRDECVAPGEVLGMCNNSGDPCTSDRDCRSRGDTCDLPEDNVDCIIPFTRRAVIFGGPGADRITAGGGDDELFGDGDNDKISGGDGNDEIHGGSGDDVLDGGAGNDALYGEGDNDVLSGGPDNCLTSTGDCQLDIVTGKMVGDILDGGSGDDDLNGGPGTNSIETGPGNNPDGIDLIIGGTGDDTIQGFFGDDILYGDEILGCSDPGSSAGGIDRIDGGPGDDQLFGGEDDDVLGGEEGDDLLCGNGGNDMLDGDDLDDGTPDGDDTIFGGPGEDQLFGRGGHDSLHGEDDNDALYGGADPDDLIGGDGRDILFGGIGNDILLGDNGSIGDHDEADHDDTGSDSPILSVITRQDGTAVGAIVEHCVVTLDFEDQPVLDGVGNSDCLFGEDESDFLFGEAGDDRMFGDGAEGECNEMFGMPHTDYMEGNSGNDVMRGGIDDDELYGNDGDDGLFGDSGMDRMFGGPDDDLMRGGKGDDYLEGNEDNDTLFGDAGQDDMIGGSASAGALDGDDIMFGNADQDVLVGDNATIVRPGGQDTADGTIVRLVTLLDLVGDDTSFSGNDEIHGNSGNDDLYGGGSDDLIHGDDGDDYLEGNRGSDTMYGDSGQDDALGGTSQEGIADGDDTIYGGDASDDLPEDFDVLLGDNGQITRPLDGDGQWMLNSFNGAVARDVTLFDVATVTDSVEDITSGGDFIFGEGDDDILFGQGGNDEMHGGSGDDRIEGNAGDDILNGNAGDDDMVGGTGRINDDPPNGVNGRLDGSDTMHGHEGFDVLAGDNAVIARTLVDGQWQSNTFNDGTQHQPRILLDIDSEDTALVSAGDVMYGDDDDDLLYGQGGDDEIHGNGGDDFIEGNADGDTLTGDDGQDDIIGGTVVGELTDGADTLSGNDADDVVIGDNGIITRPLSEAGQWLLDLNTGGVIRDVVLLDVAIIESNVDAAFSGGDTINGNAGNDRLFGQGGDDDMAGGDHRDYVEGNHGNDIISGGSGQDNLIGGGSANDGIISVLSVGDGLLDDEDEIDGGEGGDVIAGDNAKIVDSLDDDGFWVIDPNSGDFVRGVLLFDVESVLGPPIDPATSGSDRLFGESGRDFIFGQGNTQSDDDGDGRSNEDPPDGVDNDRDGREGDGSDVYDCLDGMDNDDDGLIDADDPDCAAAIDEDGGGDEIRGGPGIDYLEGNHGSDWIFGDADEDDIIGGSSAGDGAIGAGAVPFELADGDDVIAAGDDDDVVLGDNGIIERPVDEFGIWLRHTGFGFDLAVRETTVAQKPESVGAFGHDFVQGGAGHDDIYGLQGNDYLEGNDGEDAILGDLGKITNNVEDGSREELIETQSPFLEDVIFEAGTFHRLAELYSFEDGDGAAGDDILLGGDGRDSIHGGPGNDFINGDGDSIDGEDPVPDTDDEDHIFGGDGHDVMWGGRGHDHLWGGHGEDYMDVRPRTASEVSAPDTPEWFTYGEPDHYQDLDIIYGGWDADGMQANVAESGPVDADRLIDWAGGYNVFYVCPGAYGEGTITRSGSPSLRDFLRALADGDGASLPTTEGTSGFREVAYVFPNERGANSHPPHPDHPGHFVCDEEP